MLQTLLHMQFNEPERALELLEAMVDTASFYAATRNPEQRLQCPDNDKKSSGPKQQKIRINFGETLSSRALEQCQA